MADRQKPGTFDSAGRRKVAAWISEHGMSQAAFARLVGTSALAISNVLTGRTSRPSFETCVRIEKFTKGAIKCLDWDVG